MRTILACVVLAFGCSVGFGRAATIELSEAELRSGGDAAAVINAAIGRLPEAGGVVSLAAAGEPYEIRSSVTIDRGGVTLVGNGATLLMADGALTASPGAAVTTGAVVDCVEVVGSEAAPVEGVTVRGLNIDANYWNQPGAYNPRGFDSDFATGIVVEDVTIDRAFVGFTFGRGVTDSVARQVRVTRWYDDGFNASGDGYTASCARVRFVECVAEDSPDERAGGLPGNRNNAWEIEDGTDLVTLERCVVRRCGGNGFAVRNHGFGYPVHTTRTRFVGCRAEGVAGLGFFFRGGEHPNTVEDVSLERCSSDSVCLLGRQVYGLRAGGCVFTAAVTIGPARDVAVRGGSFEDVRVWSRQVGEPNAAGAFHTGVAFEGVTLNEPVVVFGNAHYVTVAPE